MMSELAGEGILLLVLKWHFGDTSTVLQWRINGTSTELQWHFNGTQKKHFWVWLMWIIFFIVFYKLRYM